MNKNEKRAMECIIELHKQIKITLDAATKALLVMGMAIDLLTPERNETE